MSKVLKTLAVSMFVLLANLSTAKADLPPAAWHCLSQDECIAVLREFDVAIYRKGVLKETFSRQGGSGKIRASNGWLAIGELDSVSLVNLSTSYTCVTYPLGIYTKGIVWVNSNDPSSGFAFFVSPLNEKWSKMDLDCSNLVEVSSAGRPPIDLEITPDDTVYFLNAASGNISHYKPLTQSGSMAYIFDTDVEVMRYHTLTNRLLLLAGDNIKYKDVPVLDGNPVLFYSLPFSVNGAGHMAVSDTHILISREGSQQAYLIDIANQTHTPLYVNNAGAVALSNSTAYVIDRGVNIKSFDLNGNLIRETSSLGSDIDYIAPILPPSCGNGLVEPGEVCDGTDFDGDSCQARGFDIGELTCNSSCTGADASACEYVCGNGSKAPTEQCDGADLGGETCQSQGFVSGALSCNNDCTFDFSQCDTCGNNITDDWAGETCDGTDTPGMICQTIPGGGFTGGELICNSSCSDYDTSGCWTCGDGIVNANEECDGADLNGLDCNALGLGGGTLSCFANCTFNITGCDNAPAEFCGNGIVDPGEDCDDGDRSNTDDPAPGETLRCSENCKYIPSTCGQQPYVIDAGEECDGTNLGSATCQDFGYTGGVLYCDSACRLKKDGCSFENTQTISLELHAQPEPGELSASLQEEYARITSTMTPSCLTQTVNGDTIVTTQEGSYCAVRAAQKGEDGNFRKIFDLLYFPENPLEDKSPILRIYSYGKIAQNYGGHLTAYRGLDITVEIVQNSIYQFPQRALARTGMKFVSVNPKTQVAGNWIGFKGDLDLLRFCASEEQNTDEGICGYVAGADEEWQYVNIDAFFDSLVSSRKPHNKSGCNTSNTTSPSPLSVILLMLVLLRIKRRKYHR